MPIAPSASRLHRWRQDRARPPLLSRMTHPIPRKSSTLAAAPIRRLPSALRQVVPHPPRSAQGKLLNSTSNLRPDQPTPPPFRYAVALRPPLPPSPCPP